MLEDMLKTCVLDFKDSWENHVPLIEFTYNNGYQATTPNGPHTKLYMNGNISYLYIQIKMENVNSLGLK